ncbi:MAG: FAD-binding protein [Herpetosiphonaceae bacterium]|nr:FAD-binding protein [Herpetosiphonaceae bacterium]
MQWSNWSASVTCQPMVIRYPQSLDEIVAIVNECRQQGRGLRVVGSGHSFTPLVATDGVLISLDHYSGLEQIDVAAGTATVRGGTKIKALGTLLSRHGLAQENLGDIDAQSIAGAISTGTHGTGLTLGSISTQVIGMTLVTGQGEVLVCSEHERPEILRAAQVSLGALGIIASVTLRLVPAYRLEYVWRRENLGLCLEQLGHNTAANRNFEFYWLPHTDKVMTKRMNISQQAAHSQLRHTLRHYQELVLENSVLWLISEVCRHFPTATPAASGLIASLVSSGMDINDSHKIFATPRLVRFQEMEYSLPLENLAVALEAIDRCIRRRRFQVHFPLECRVVRGDDIDLSPAAGRDSAYIAAHMYKGMAYHEYFAALEDILRSYGGRPHWGKLHSLTARELAPLYPRWEHFQAVRASLDPAGLLLNPYLRRILGVGA